MIFGDIRLQMIPIVGRSSVVVDMRTLEGFVGSAFMKGFGISLTELSCIVIGPITYILH